MKLHWSLHPDRDQEWRDEQDVILGPSLAAQECLWGKSTITIKDIDTNDIKDITLEELYKDLSNE